MSINPLHKGRELIKIKGFVVLSLFDGMSCGQQALERLGIKDNYTYFSSEVDKYAMQVTRYNYQNTIFLGSVTEITIERYSEHAIILNGKYIIDTRFLILIGGSPCQGFSFAGKQKGASAINKETDAIVHIDITSLEQYLDLKDKEFEFNGQSYLFWEYIRIKRELEKYNSDLIFLLENVKMVKKWSSMFDSAVGSNSVFINSALVSAQNRQRLYWSPKGEDIEQPEDKEIYLKNILETGFTDRDKSFCIDANYWKGGNLSNYFQKSRRQLVFHKPNTYNLKLRSSPSFSKDGLCHIANADIKGNRIYSPNGKAIALSAQSGGTAGNGNLLIVTSEQFENKEHTKYLNTFKINPSIAHKYTPKESCNYCDPYNKKAITNGKATALRTNSSNGNMWVAVNPSFIPLCGAMRGRYLEDGVRKDAPKGASNAGKTKQYIEVRHDGKTNCLTTVQKEEVNFFKEKREPTLGCNSVVYIDIKDHYGRKVRYELNDIDWRKLTPIECERLQTVFDNYTSFGLDELFQKVNISNTQRYKMLGNGWTVDVIVHIFKKLGIYELYLSSFEGASVFNTRAGAFRLVDFV